MTLFYAILPFHLAAVLAKLSVFAYVPRLRDAEAVKAFFARYKRWDRIANWAMWITGALLIAVTSWRFLLQAWLLVSMLLYILLFVIIRAIMFRRLRLIAESRKVFAREELQVLRTESWCVAIVAIGLLGGIGFLMATKPII